MSTTTRIAPLAATAVLAAGLGGCAATGLTDAALEITKAEAAATIAHLSNTEPEFAGFVAESSGWAVFPGMMYGHSYLFGGGGGDGLVYNSSGEAVGYSRQVRLTLGIGSFGQYNDHVVFFPDDAAMETFKGGNWEVGGEAAAGIYGLGASGEISFSNYNVVADPRFSGGAYVAFTFDNYSYNDLAAAMGN
ncbi:MAG: hypothetical protein AAGF47_00770 [Planctomycetota bacterium]